jgi:tetratricopeptide (TPR) repeat protein
MRRVLPTLALALAVRLCVLAYASRLPLFAHHRLDEFVYDEAGRLIAGGDLTLGREVFHMSPGYSYFVGAIYALAGDGAWPVRIVQLLLGLATVALIIASARRIAGEPGGTIAGVVAALYGPFAFYETLLLATSLGVFAHALLIYSSLRAIERPNARRWSYAGLALGAAVVIRPNALLLAIPLAIVAWRSSRRFTIVLALAGATALVIAPVTLRNLVVAGEPVLVTDSGGLNFFIGNGKGAIGTFRIPRDVPDADSAKTQFPAFRRVAEQHEGRALRSREVDAFWYRVAYARIRQDPSGWLRLMGKKLALFWNERELPNTEDYAFARTLNPGLAWLIGYGMLAPFALIGTLLLLAGSTKQRLLGWMNALACAGVVLFFVLGHYRMAAVPGLIIAAVFALERLYEAATRPSKWRMILLGVALIAATAIVTAPARLPQDVSDPWFKLGYAYQLDGRLDEAERCYLRALALDGENLSAEKNLAILYESLGKRARALELWQKLVPQAHAAGDVELERFAEAHALMQ